MSKRDRHKTKDPHVAQAATKYAAPYFNSPESRRPRSPETVPKAIDAGSEQMKFVDRPGWARSTLHWGQRKLCVTEIRFLTEVLDSPLDSAQIVYAGAAPGVHIPFLASLFPNCVFDLYDPAPFDSSLIEAAKESTSLNLYNTFFDRKLAGRYSMDNVVDECLNVKFLFISDIRSSDPRVQEKEEVEKDVQEDMAQQRDWCLEMRPYASLLKFRLPWAAGATEYLRGEVWLQPWAPTTSTETRLYVRREDLDTGPVTYDNTAYERAMAFHNTVGRARLYDHRVSGVPGLDRCGDCALEVWCLKQYLRRQGAVDLHSVSRLANLLSENLGQESGRTLATPYSCSSTRCPFPARILSSSGESF